MITYEEINRPRQRWEIRVRLDGKLAGTIRLVDGGFRYFPKGGSRGMAGELFKTVREVQQSLEPDDFCAHCSCSLTSTDCEAGRCTQCGCRLEKQ
jgi:hypothetical protein